MRKSLLIAGLLGITQLTNAQSNQEPSYTVVDGYMFTYLSNDGKWALENLPNGQGSNVYSVEENQVVYYPEALFNAVSTDGILVGKKGNTHAAYYENDEWHLLPYPSNDKLYLSGTAWDITEDGSMICGALTFQNIREGGTQRKPCIWIRQADGTYELSILPAPEKDYTHLTPQAVDAMFCTKDVIAGRVIDWSGFRNYAISWKKDQNGNWEYQELGLNAIFNEGIPVPQTLPIQPEQPNPMEYFTEADSLQYAEDLEKYENGEISKNPEYYQYNYITDIDSLAAYAEAEKKYQEEFSAYQQDVEMYNDSLSKATTGDRLDMFSCRKSASGRYLTVNYNYAVEPRKRKTVPAYFNLSDGTLTICKDLGGFGTGVTTEGTLVYATPADNPIRTSYVKKNNSEPCEFAAWIKEQTNGVIDIEDEYTFSFTYYEDRIPIEVTDSLVVGTVFPSDDENLFMGFLQTPDTGKKISYFINLGKKNPDYEYTAPQGLSMNESMHRLNFIWQDPAGMYELGYCPKEHKEGAGIGNEGKPIIAAIQFSPNDQQAYIGYYLNSVTFFANQKYFEPDRKPTQMKLAIFIGGKERIVDQEITSLKENAWNTVRLEKPLQITGEKSLQVGLEVVQHDEAEWPLATYNKSQESGKSDLFSVDGGQSWQTLKAAGKNNAWNLYADIAANPETAKTANILGYKLYCNGEPLNEDLILQQNTYTDKLLNTTYFAVSAVYEGGIESELSNELYWKGVGIEEINTGDVSYYDQTLWIEGEYDTLLIYSITGILIETYNQVASQINLSHLSDGVYIAVLQKDGQQTAYRIVK